MPKKTSKEYSQDYSKPVLRKKLKDKIRKESKGGKAGKWSARKAQLLKKTYEEKGGGYKHSGKKTLTQKNLTQWSKKNSSDTEDSRKKKSYIPPPAAAKAAAKGLQLRKKFHKGGTQIGVARATQLKNRHPVSISTLKRMHSYFSRHAVDKKAEDFGKSAHPSKGYIAWLLWGGDPGVKWVKKILLQINKRESP
jgi:hypothetical protein